MFRAKSVLALAVGFALSCGTATGQQEIKFAHPGDSGSLFDRCAQEFAHRANAKLNNRAKVVLYGSSRFGGDFELMNKLKLGTVDLALPSSVMSSYVPLFGLFEMPYLVKSRAHMMRIRDEIVIPIMAPAAEKEGYRIIAVWENGFRHITNNKRPIVKPDDLKGLNLRVPQGGWRVRMFEAYGANPIPLPPSEVFLALQIGAMDGQENPLAQIYPYHFYEVQKFLSLTAHVYTPAYLTAGRSWDSLSPEVQKILADTAKDMQPEVATLAAALEDDFLKKLKETGIQINEADREAFIGASGKIYQQFSTGVPDGKMLVKKAIELGS